jgi:CRP-like cAMP-binding protein
VPPSSTRAETLRKLLAEQELFARLGEDELDGLAEVANTRKIAAGAELFHKGDPGSQMFVVASGVLKAVTTSSEGDDVVFSVMGAGEVIGELALLSGGRRSATIVAMEAAEVIVLERRSILPFLRAHPEAAFTLLAVLAERVQRISEMVEDTHFRNLPSRLAKKLLELNDRFGTETGSGIRIDLRMSQEELGDLVATTRESINKQMKDWQKAGVASMLRGHIMIHDLDALTALVEQDA